MPESLAGARADLVRSSLDLDESSLDRGEIRAVGRQGWQHRAAILDCLADAGDFVDDDIVRHDGLFAFSVQTAISAAIGVRLSQGEL